MKHRKSKKFAQMKHAQSRAQSRLGINFNEEARRQLINRIQDGELKFLYKQSCRVSCWRDTINGKEIDVLYDKLRHVVITFLNPEPEEVYEMIRRGAWRVEAQRRYYEEHRERKGKASQADVVNIPPAQEEAPHDGAASKEV